MDRTSSIGGSSRPEGESGIVAGNVCSGRSIPAALGRSLHGGGGAAGCRLPFEVEEILFAPQSAAVSTEGSVASDDAVAGDEDGDGVFAVGAAHGALGAGATDATGKLGIRSSGSAGDVPEGVPDAELEIRAAHVEGQGEIGSAAEEIPAQFPGEGIEVRVRAGGEHGAEAAAEQVHLSWKRATIGEFEQADSLLGGPGDKGTEGGVKALHVNYVQARAARRRGAKDFLEGIPESAGGFVTLVQTDGERVVSVLQFAQGRAHAAHAVVGLKGHAEVPLKIAAGAVGADAHSRKVAVLDSVAGKTFKAIEEGLKPVCVFGRGGEGSTTAAGAKTVEEAVADGGAVEDVAVLRRSGGTGGATKNAGAADADVEQPVVGGVAAAVGAAHFLVTQSNRVHGESLPHGKERRPPGIERGIAGGGRAQSDFARKRP